jgi:uncharacterized protein UPF0158
MSDTSPEIEEKYRTMLMARSGEERLKIGGSMYTTARALVTASILEQDPAASPAALRQALFLRFYGHEFDAVTRGRILARLAFADEGEPPRVRKRVPVDWHELEIALTWHSDELTHFLHVRTGEVRQYRLAAFAADREDFELTEDEEDEGLAEGNLIKIEPIESSVEYGWMAEFAASVSDPRLRDRLETALHGRGPFRRFKDVLGGEPTERGRWFRFREERVREAIREWLDDNDIEPTTPSTARSSEP